MPRIEDIVLGALRAINAGRAPDQQLPVTLTAPVFGPDSPLDSLGLVALLVEIEDLLAAGGDVVNLSDAQAMSASHSPFRDVPSLVAFVRQQLEVQACPPGES
jgi:hypothetical protein